MWYFIKLFITAGLIVLISEISRRFSLIGSLLAALPITSILAMIWMHAEGTPPAQIAEFSRGVFWMVLPSLPMFLVLPPLMEKFGFPPAMLLGSLLTAAFYFLLRAILVKFQILI